MSDNKQILVDESVEARECAHDFNQWGPVMGGNIHGYSQCRECGTYKASVICGDNQFVYPSAEQYASFIEQSRPMINGYL